MEHSGAMGGSLRYCDPCSQRSPRAQFEAGATGAGSQHPPWRACRAPPGKGAAGPHCSPALLSPGRPKTAVQASRERCLAVTGQRLADLPLVNVQLPLAPGAPRLGGSRGR